MQVSIPYWRHASNFTRIKYLIVKKLIKQTQAIGPLAGGGRKCTIMYLRSYVLFLKLRENFRDISRNCVNELSYITRLKRLHHVCTQKLRIGRNPIFPLVRTVGSTFGILKKRKLPIWGMCRRLYILKFLKSGHFLDMKKVEVPVFYRSTLSKFNFPLKTY